jgi:UDP-N-acetylglucosamine diphosphorylase/glucosamine-1-phosphate N-acetyltransferase
MTNVYLLSPDRDGGSWAPFAGATPLSELRAGGWRLRERWELGLDARTAAIASALLAEHATGAPPLITAAAINGPAWVVDVTFAPKLPMRSVGRARRLLHGGRTVAWRLEAGEAWTGPFDHGDGLVIEGRALAGAFDLIGALEQLLFTDTVAALDRATDPFPDGTIVFGNPGAIGLHGATLEPGVILDVTKGAIILERGVQVRSGTRLEGPLWVRENTWILGGHLRHVTVGPGCRLHGEISTSVFNGFANKSHDGFIGHSVVGEWVNIGAGTITSNLKNTYGPVRLDVGDVRIETHRTNVGALIGDHAKIAIGTLLPTGSVVGAGANLFGAPRAAKYTPPFAWGDTGERVGADQFVAMAERVLPRRDMEVTPAVVSALRAMHRRMTAE